MDITERRRAEESLRRKESELTEAQRLAGIGSWQWDCEQRNEVVWSDELYRIAGWSLARPGRAPSNHPHLYPPENWERIQRCGRTSDAIRHAVRARRRDVQQRWDAGG